MNVFTVGIIGLSSGPREPAVRCHHVGACRLVHVDEKSHTTLHGSSAAECYNSLDVLLLDGVCQGRSEVFPAQRLHYFSGQMTGEAEEGSRYVLLVVTAVQVRIGELNPLVDLISAFLRGDPNDYVVILADPPPVEAASPPWHMHRRVLAVTDDGVCVVGVQPFPHVHEDLLPEGLPSSWTYGLNSLATLLYEAFISSFRVTDVVGAPADGAVADAIAPDVAVVAGLM